MLRLSQIEVAGNGNLTCCISALMFLANVLSPEGAESVKFVTKLAAHRQLSYQCSRRSRTSSIGHTASSCNAFPDTVHSIPGLHLSRRRMHLFRQASPCTGVGLESGHSESGVLKVSFQGPRVSYRMKSIQQVGHISSISMFFRVQSMESGC